MAGPLARAPSGWSVRIWYAVIILARLAIGAGRRPVAGQRLRPAAAASSYTACPMCEGHGAVRTTESAALVALRKIHVRIAEGDIAQMKVGLPRDVAMYLLNQKRDDLATLEARYAARIQIV